MAPKNSVQLNSPNAAEPERADLVPSVLQLSAKNAHPTRTMRGRSWCDPKDLDQHEWLSMLNSLPEGVWEGWGMGLQSPFGVAHFLVVVNQRFRFSPAHPLDQT